MSDPVTQATDAMVEFDKMDIHPVARPFLFLGRADVQRNFIWLPLIGMIVTIVLGVFHPLKHPLPHEDKIIGSWAIFGFFAYSLIVLSAPGLFRLLARDEDYYGEGGLPDPEVSTDPLYLSRLKEGEAEHD